MVEKRLINFFVFGLSLIGILGFLFATHIITTSGGNSFSINENTNSFFNISVNNTGVGQVANITQINITLPSSGNCSFVFGSNDSDSGADTFANNSNVLSWTNSTGYVINGSEKKYFWFNASCVTPGNFNITIVTVNGTGNNENNLTLEVNDTLDNITGCGTITETGNYVLNQSINSSGTCLTIAASNVVVDCQGHAINFSESEEIKYGVYSLGYNEITIKNCAINQVNDSIRAKAGIFLENSENSSILNNSITLLNASDNTPPESGYGIFMKNSSSANITLNKINITWGVDQVYGMLLQDGVNDSIIHSNNVTTNCSNLSVGISLGASSGYYVYNSNLTNNRITSYGSNMNGGIAIVVGGTGNLIYNNYFNSPNSSYSGFTSETPWYAHANESNSLNTSKTSGTNIVGKNYLGGNYWTNPSGTGYSDTCTEATGDYICDEAYILDSGNTDYYPLTTSTTYEEDGDDSDSLSPGGSTTPSYWTNTYLVDDEDFEKSFSREMKKKHRVRVKVNGEIHYVGIIQIDEDNEEVTINITSDPIQVVLSVGEDAKVDVTNDSYYDIYVLLNGIDKDSNEANLTIKSIYEEIPEGETVGGTGDATSGGENTSEGEESEDREEKDVKKYVIWALIIVGFVLLIVGGYFYWNTKKRNKK